MKYLAIAFCLLIIISYKKIILTLYSLVCKYYKQEENSDDAVMTYPLT